MEKKKPFTECTFPYLNLYACQKYFAMDWRYSDKRFEKFSSCEVKN